MLYRVRILSNDGRPRHAAAPPRARGGRTASFPPLLPSEMLHPWSSTTEGRGPRTRRSKREEGGGGGQ